MQILKQKPEAVSLYDIRQHLLDLSAWIWIQVWAGLSWQQDNAAGMNFASSLLHVSSITW